VKFVGNARERLKNLDFFYEDVNKKHIFYWILDKGITIIGFITVFLIFSLGTDRFLTPSNLINIARQIPALGILSIGMTYVILTGNIDLSAGSAIALSGVFLASFMEYANMGLTTSVIITCTIMAGIYGAIGVLIAYQNLPSFIVTVATLTAFRGLAFLYSNKPIYVRDPSLRELGRGSTAGIPNAFILMLIVYALFYFILSKTQFGKHVYAVGDNPEAARRFGVNVPKVTILVFMLHGITVALSSTIIAGRLSSGSPNAGSLMELDAIAAVVFGGTRFSGGKGSLIGTLLGVILLGMLNNGLNIMGVSSYHQMVVRGMIIILAVWLNYLRRFLER